MKIELLDIMLQAGVFDSSWQVSQKYSWIRTVLICSPSFLGLYHRKSFSHSKVK